MKGSRFGQQRVARNAAYRKPRFGEDETVEVQRSWHVPARAVPLPGASSPQGTTEVCDVIGTCVYRNGSTYEGGWLNGQHHGAGTAVDKDGWKYDGEWVQGVPHGFGRAEYSVGTYQGEWRNGQRHGHGVWSSSAGEHYCGGWKAGVRNGQGKWSYKDYTYTGGWLNGEFSGHGEQTWGSYDNTGVGLGLYGTYVGEFKHNVWHGKGKVSANSTTEYEGTFRQGLKSGFGTFRFGDQLVFEGLFEADHPLEPIKGFSQPQVGRMFDEDLSERIEELQLGVQKRMTQRALSNLEVSEIVQPKDESSVGVVCRCCTRFFMRCLRKDQLKEAAAQAVSDWTARKLLHGLGEWQRGASQLRAQKHSLRVAVVAFDASAVRLRLPALRKWRTQAPLLRQKWEIRALRAPELVPLAHTPDSMKVSRGNAAAPDVT